MTVHPVTSSERASRPNERRRNPRPRASSIIYADLGSGNGGIVLNLGIHGVACQVATELTAKRNSTLNVRLRGSGLNAELVGELVWLGATHKQAGICFKNLSANVQQAIANWIARETQVFETAASEKGTRQKPMPTMRGISATEEKSVPHSLSAAFAMSRATSVDPPPGADAVAHESCFPASLDSASGTSGTTLLPEIVSPIQHGNVSADELDDRPQGRNADSFAQPEQCQVEQPLPNQSPSEMSPIGQPDQFPTYVPFRVLLPEEPRPSVSEELPQAPAEPPGQSEFIKTEEIEPIRRDRVSRSPDRWFEAIAEQKWIPPELLAAWEQRNRQQKVLLASTAAVCLLVFALILTVAVAHTDGSSGRSRENGSQKQSSAPLIAPSVIVRSPQTGSLQSPPAPRAAARPQSHQPPTSLRASLARIVFGYQPETRTELDEYHVGVQVWTSRSSGYYYCADNSFYMKVLPGTFMAQGDALQSGYRPKLGKFCD